MEFFIKWRCIMYRCIVCGEMKFAVNAYLGSHPICSASCVQNILDCLMENEDGKTSEAHEASPQMHFEWGE